MTSKKIGCGLTAADETESQTTNVGFFHHGQSDRKQQHFFDMYLANKKRKKKHNRTDGTSEKTQNKQLRQHQQREERQRECETSSSRIRSECQKMKICK